MNNTSVHTDPTSAAKAMRIELKKKFPGIKFRVTTKKYAGGNSIRVNWVLGPTTAAVEAVINKYQYGTFDGMTDSYTHDETLVSMPDGSVKGLGGAKYVFAERDYAEKYDDSDNFRTQVAKDLCALEGVEYKGMNTNVTGKEEWNRHCSLDTVIGELLSKTDLTNGYKGVRRTATTFGASWADFYEVIPEKV